MRKNWFVFLTFVASVNAWAEAEIPYSAIQPNPSSLKLGDRLSLQISALHPEIAGRQKITAQTLENQDWLLVTEPVIQNNSYIFKVIPLVEGKKEFPGLRLVDQSGQVFALTKPISAQIQGIGENEAAAPSRQDFQFKSFPWGQFALYFLVFSLTVGTMLFLYLRKKPPIKSPSGPVSDASPYELTWRTIDLALQQIENCDPIQLRQISHVAADSVRQLYSIEHAKNFDDLTSKELVREIEKLVGSGEQIRLLRALLRYLDEVRFSENRNTLTNKRELRVQFESWVEFKKGKAK